jgi:hypothetical protein
MNAGFDGTPTFLCKPSNFVSRDFTFVPTIAMPRNLLRQRLVQVVVWRLRDSAGIEMQCVLTAGEQEAWELRVEWGSEVTIVERHASIDAALTRADALWIEYLLDGWGEA